MKMYKNRVFSLIIIIIIITIVTFFAIRIYNENIPYKIVVKDVKGVVNSDFQETIIKNKFGKTLAKGKDVINPKTIPVEDNKLSYKIDGDVIEIETLYWGGIVVYNFSTMEFDYTNFETKTEIKNPNGELQFPKSSYYGGEKVELFL